MASSDWPKWQEAMKKELNSHADLGTWSEVKGWVPKRPIHSKWVFVKKYTDGVLDKYRARLVACGCSQRWGVDYDRTFAPTARLTSYRVLLAIAAHLNLNLNHLDITTAFLWGKLQDNEQIYMRLPEPHKGSVVRLIKSIYGLKQASRRWNQKMDSVMKAFGFGKTNYADACMYYMTKGDAMLLIIVHVDDKVVAWRGEDLYEAFKAHCSKHYVMKDLGPLEFALGMRVTRDRSARSISLDQEAATREILSSMNMMDCRSVKTPQVAKQYLQPQPHEVIDTTMAKVPYRTCVGKLQYLCQGTRPDIANATRELGRFANNPNQEHWKAAKHLLRYLRGTLNYKLTFSGALQLRPFCDADFANSADRKSVSGMVVMLGSAPVSWSSKKQSTVSCSSTEAEYNSLSETAREVVWLRLLLKEMGEQQEGPTTVFEDNQQTIVWAQDPKHHGRNKHLDVKLHYIREQVARKTLAVEYVSTQNQLADVMTKPLGRVTFERLVDMIMWTQRSRTDQQPVAGSEATNNQ